MMNFDPKKRALQELMAHLDKSDDDDLSSAVNPKGPGVEVTKVGVMADPKDPDGDGDDDSKEMDAGTSMGDGMGGDGGGPKMSDEELEELIQALSAKLG